MIGEVGEMITAMVLNHVLVFFDWQTVKILSPYTWFSLLEWQENQTCSNNSESRAGEASKLK